MVCHETLFSKLKGIFAAVALRAQVLIIWVHELIGSLMNITIQDFIKSLNVLGFYSYSGLLLLALFSLAIEKINYFLNAQSTRSISDALRPHHCGVIC